MPEKGWSKLTVRKLTTEEIRDKARNEGLTIDEYLHKIMRRSEATYEKCLVCRQKVPKEDFGFHLMAHVKANPDALLVRKGGKCRGCGGQELLIRLKDKPDMEEVSVHSHLVDSKVLRRKRKKLAQSD